MRTSEGAEARHYLTSHPWLTFKVDLQKAPAKFWLRLGEAQSKCRHIAGVPLRPQTAQELHQLYLAKGVAATTSIEGNTLTEEEVRRRLEGALAKSDSNEYQIQEVDNISQGITEIGRRVLNAAQHGGSHINYKDLVEYNRIVLKELQLEEGIVAGVIPSREVGVPGYRGAPREDCEYLLNRLIDWLNSNEFAPTPGDEIVYALIKAAIAHLYIAWIHPFGDGNGRTARLVEFRVLFEAGVPSPAAHLLSNHYNLTRREYYRELDRASQSGGEVIPFMMYAVDGFVLGLAKQLDMIRDQQMDTVWRSHVHELFKGRESPAELRRRHLVLDISLMKEAVLVSEVRRISPRIAEEYAGKTSKTVSRDLNRLKQMDLIRLERGRVLPNYLQVIAFLPPSTELPWFKGPTKT